MKAKLKTRHLIACFYSLAEMNSDVVRGAGIEPARSCEQQILSLSWLPVTTPAQKTLL